MKIKYLGTAACEGFPAAFCDCEACKRARLLGGRNIRTRSQAIVDDWLLIDFPPDTYIHSLYNGIELSKIHTCLITHKHEDHLYANELANRKISFAYPEEGPLSFYVTNPSYKMIDEFLRESEMENQNRVKVSLVEFYHEFVIEGYGIIPLKANHDAKCDPAIFLIRHNGKAMLYAHDTGVFPEETWAYLQANPIRMDLISLDCTHGINEKERDGHMGLVTDIEVRQKLMELGCADEKTKFVVNHFSHNGLATYDELLPIACEQNFIVSYDGMSVEF